MKDILVEVFKTNITDKEDADKILEVLNKLFPKTEINFDLEDCDNILRVEGEDFLVDQIIEKLSEYGFLCEVLQ